MKKCIRYIFISVLPKTICVRVAEQVMSQFHRGLLPAKMKAQVEAQAEGALKSVACHVVCSNWAVLTSVSKKKKEKDIHTRQWHCQL